MATIRNTTPENLALPTGTKIPAGAEVEISEQLLAHVDNVPWLTPRLNNGRLVVERSAPKAPEELADEPEESDTAGQIAWLESATRDVLIEFLDAHGGETKGRTSDLRTRALEIAGV